MSATPPPQRLFRYSSWKEHPQLCNLRLVNSPCPSLSLSQQAFSSCCVLLLTERLDFSQKQERKAQRKTCACIMTLEVEASNGPY
ncbi:hypothetical protein CEXT_812151 [Caerostris extrusa]|uniref:Uncharacterized protein n=1 Tax=Caerostris extrusa TaxID=172846 RepID=A0AAV4TFJ0_CAEEX|nr:hypothetical protein CEXT_812151 [Caerostris extrusa]